MDKKNEYVYLDSSNVEHKINISKEDFALACKDEKIHDVKFKTKPTTFFKDAIKRFSKNKSSVAGGIILGTLLLLSIVVPFADTADIDSDHPEETLLEGKLFSYNGGFWDGSRYIENIACDESNGSVVIDGVTYLYPDKDAFPAASVKDLTAPKKGYLTDVSNTATGGFVNIINDKQVLSDDDAVANFDKELNSKTYEFDITKDYTLDVVLLDEQIEGYSVASLDVNFVYTVNKDDAKETTYSFTDIKHKQTSETESTNENTETLTWEKSEMVDDLENTRKLRSLKVENFLEKVIEADEAKGDQKEGIKEYGIKEGKISFTIYKDLQKDDESIAFKSVVVTEKNGDVAREIPSISFTDPKTMVLGKPTDYNYWSTTAIKRLYLGIGNVCSFRWDTYEAAYGIKTKEVGYTEISKYIEKGWISSDFTEDAVRAHRANINEFYQSCKTSLTDDYSPISEIKEVKISRVGDIVAVTLICNVYNDRYLGYTSRPVWLFGTDKHGKDMLKQVFVGLRTSLALGLLTFAICFTFGLIYGSISGYFGGTVDLILERFTDILSGVPWIVVMTLCILNLGSSFFVFILAMCLTGWIGTAALTRTQFYRYRDREYTLASRTLGARDTRLIFRHILPNAMGTIITSSVLMIPSVIFSEATLSYLGLGFNNLHSLGVILSDNQAYLSTYPVLIIFPSIIMALIMISFNLFGNGLRDAFNPSLKGSD